MRKNTKILIGIGVLAVGILTLSVVKTFKDAENSLVIKPADNTPPPIIETVKTELPEVNIKQDELFEVQFSGFEGNGNVFVIQKDIPVLKERIATRVNELDAEINVSDEETGSKLAEEQRFVRMLEDKAFCSYKGEGNIKNGDEIVINCDSESLKKVNIIVDSTYSVKVDGLNPYVEPENEEQVNNNVPVEEPEKEAAYIGLHENGKYAWIYPYDIDNLNTDDLPETVETTIIFVNTQEEFDQIKEKALNGELKVDEIQFLNDVYEKTDNFTEAEEWKGVAG